jgi:hypothetical protein
VLPLRGDLIEPESMRLMLWTELLTDGDSLG